MITVTDSPATAVAEVCAYDFDGTLTTADTLIEFLKHAFGTWRLRMGLVAVAPWLVAMKLGLIPSGKAKQRLLRLFLKGMPTDRFKEKCEAFAADSRDRLLRPEGLDSIKEDIGQGRKVAIVSASISDWIRPFFHSPKKNIEVDVICTELEVRNGRLTGRFATPNCRGEEKVHRLEDFYGSGLSSYLYAAYGDTKGDLPMLSHARHPHYKPWT